MPSRIGLFGGTFDPPHLGHLVAAERALTELALDEVRFVPVGTPALKGEPAAPAALRWAMVGAAVAGRAGFTRDDLELRRPGVSYTADTLQALAEAHPPDAQRWLLLGADALADFERWRRPEQILELARLAVVARPGADLESVLAALQPTVRVRVDVVPMPRLDIASRELRAEVRAGRSIRYLVPDAVAALIVQHRLYQNA